MDIAQIQPGDMVFAAADLFSDGEIPGYAEGALVVKAGTRGELINTGHYEEYPDVEFYLVIPRQLSCPVGDNYGVRLSW